MAPARTPGKKRQREGDYLAVGREGRKTGLTVPDLGPRDEHGLEPVDKLFSSPQKGRTPSRQNVTTDDSDSESMEVTNGTSDNASSILRSARHRSILPPRSRSPRRTNLGSSPVRPMGQVSSPLQSRHSLSQAPRRSGKFDRSDKGRIRGVDSAGPSPGSSYQRKVRSEVAEFPRRSQPRTQNYDVLEDDDEPPEEEVLEDDIAEVDAGDMDLADQPATFDADVNNDLVSPIVDDIEEQQASANESSPEPETQKTKRAPKRKNHELEVESESAGLGRRNEATKKPRGQPHEDQFSDALEEAATLDNSLVDAAPSVALAKKKKRGPGQRNPKARISSTKSRNSEREPAPAGRNKREDVSIATEDAKPKKTKPRARPLLHRQEDTPQDEEVSLKVLRSGRTSVKPLAFWRGEHIVYEPPKRMGTDWLPGGYRGIDPGRRTVEYQPKTTKRKATRTRAVSREPTESQEEPQELWETEGEVPGVLAAGVPVWDPDLEQSTEDAYEEVELALTATALDDRLQWDKKRTFKFGKTLTLPFFHSGVVELPPGGEKRPKDSRKNHMIFWVNSGRVQVDISGTEFSIGRGGMWQVPRGNMYTLSNPFRHNVRLFFAQASYMMQPEDESALLAAANGLA